jgi:hypothetical protein
VPGQHDAGRPCGIHVGVNIAKHVGTHIGGISTDTVTEDALLAFQANMPRSSALGERSTPNGVFATRQP